MTALLLVIGLAVLMRVQPERFGLERRGVSELELRPHPPEPAGPLARYEPRPTVEAHAPSAVETDAARLFEDARPGVCLVTNVLYEQSATAPHTVDQYVQGTGSGIVWDRAGHIVTSRHVVAEANSATVTLFDGSTHTARLVGVDEASDLVVMRIDCAPERLAPLRIGRSSELFVGQRIHAIGFPYQLGHTLSNGIVSGLGRTIRTPGGLTLTGVIQTDADLHPGSSGGPLLDRSARVIGLSIAVHGEARAGGRLAFALPIDVIQEVVPRIMRTGLEWFPRLGFVLCSDANSEALLAVLRVRGDEERADWRAALPGGGIVVAVVEEGSPAALAGLRGTLQQRDATGRDALTVRDIVVAVDGVECLTRDAFDQAVQGALEGSASKHELTLTVAGAAGEREVSIVMLGPE